MRMRRRLSPNVLPAISVPGGIQTIEVSMFLSPPADATIMEVRRTSMIRHPHGIIVPRVMSVSTGIQIVRVRTTEVSPAIVRTAWGVGTMKFRR